MKKIACIVVTGIFVISSIAPVFAATEIAASKKPENPSGYSIAQLKDAAQRAESVVALKNDLNPAAAIVSAQEVAAKSTADVPKDAITSPDGNRYVWESGDYLVVADNSGKVLGNILVRAQQVSLVSYNVTNTDIYMVFNQRGNTSISRASFTDLTAKKSVTLPNYISPSNSYSVILLQGQAKAYITSIDRNTYIVDFTTNTAIKTTVSPDGNRYVWESGDYLVVADNSGKVLGNIMVRAQQVSLVSYNVTNTDIYMVFNQRGNTSISRASFTDLTAKKSVTLPNYISPSNSYSVILLQGQAKAYITSIDRNTYLVNFITGTAVKTMVSPNGIRYVWRLGNYLVVADKSGKVLSNMVVNTQQYALVSYNVTNGVIFMVFNQRGNTVIMQVSFANLSVVKPVALPKGIHSLNPKSVIFIQGEAKAYVISTDGKKYLVNFITGAVTKV